ncbi:UNVERIFIED_CONTAM: hypothetical protein IGO34_30585 [Salmonella enterica subsp. enterica serovar Weltevreden]
MTTLTTPYMAQTPTMSMHEIAEILWATGQHAAYRSLMAYIKERDAMLKALTSKEET